jgi:hypothetical protein
MPLECSALISRISPHPSFKRSSFAFDLFLMSILFKTTKKFYSFCVLTETDLYRLLLALLKHQLKIKLDLNPLQLSVPAQLLLH